MVFFYYSYNQTWTSLLLKIQILSHKTSNHCSSRHFLQLPIIMRRRTISTQEIYDCNVEIGYLSRAGNIKAARHMFDEMPERDVVSWNAIVTGYWQNGSLDESKKLFELMPVKNVVSWNSMIAGCVENERIDEACEYFHNMPKRNTASWNAMLTGFVKYDRIDEATKIFDEMPERNVISYTALIDGYAQKGEIERARTLFDLIPRKNSVSWTVMITGYVENEKFDEARALFDMMPEKTVVAITAMITGYCKEGKMGNARSLFEGIQYRDIVCWNALIAGMPGGAMIYAKPDALASTRNLNKLMVDSELDYFVQCLVNTYYLFDFSSFYISNFAGYAQNGNGEEALKLLVKMLQRGIRPDHATLISVLTACSNLASLKEGRQTHLIVTRNGFSSNISVCNALMTMYNKCGSICDSETVFTEIDCPDLASWNAIIAGYAQHGHYEKALGSFDDMGLSGVKPSGVTLLSVLSACGHAGKVTESMDWFDSMLNTYGIEPKAEHYACLVDILSRAGNLEKAYKIIQEMPFEADAAVWGALLAACRLYLNVDLGELAAMELVKLDPQNPSAYVMLSNIYAAVGMWREVTRVRGLMKEQGLKKQPGYSWMEIGNKVHFFLVGDVSHPEINEIHSELGRIRMQMRTDDFGDLISEFVLV